MWAAVGGLLQTASAKARHIADEGRRLVEQSGVLDLEEEYNDGNRDIAADICGDKQGQGVAHADGEEQEGGRCAWWRVKKDSFNVPPATWESPQEEWQMLLQSVLMEANSCVVPPTTIIQDDQLSLRLCGLLGLTSVVNLPDIPALGSCGPTLEVVEWLTMSPEELEFRSFLVPCYVVDDQYWVNLAWRIRIYSMCRNSSQLLDVMEVLSTEPNPFDYTGKLCKKNIGVSNGALYWQRLREKVNSRCALAEWLEEQITNVSREMELAFGNLQLLSSLVKKREKSELGDSVLESCMYHKTKLSRIMGGLKVHQERLNNSVLCPDNGSLFAQLLEMNEALRSNVEAYVSMSSENASGCQEHDPNVIQDEGQLTVGSDKKDGLDDTVFEAELPWEDDVTK